MTKLVTLKASGRKILFQDCKANGLQLSEKETWDLSRGGLVWPVKWFYLPNQNRERERGLCKLETQTREIQAENVYWFRHEARSQLVMDFHKAELYWQSVIKLKNFPQDLLFRISRQILGNLKLFCNVRWASQWVADPHLNALKEIFNRFLRYISLYWRNLQVGIKFAPEIIPLILTIHSSGGSFWLTVCLVYHVNSQNDIII